AALSGAGAIVLVRGQLHGFACLARRCGHVRLRHVDAHLGLLQMASFGCWVALRGRSFEAVLIGAVPIPEISVSVLCARSPVRVDLDTASGDNQIPQMIAERLQPTFEQYGFTVENGPVLPGAFVGATLAVVTAHAGVHPE